MKLMKFKKLLNIFEMYGIHDENIQRIIIQRCTTISDKKLKFIEDNAHDIIDLFDFDMILNMLR